VAFLGADWKTAPPDDQAARRGRIGRVFDGHGWISNLDVDENMTLARRHHTTRPAGEIERDAEALVRRFGLPELPRLRPALMAPADLRRAEWVRAFLGEPRLVILEQPTRDVFAEAIPALAAAVDDACARGAAVLWLMDDERAWSRAAAGAAHRWKMRGAALVPREKE
jgi:phospholipid/cholesterol/gamma-HCH transport system ATP-binding protein